MAATQHLTELTALGPVGPYRARRTIKIGDVTNAPLAELSLVPSLFVTRAIDALRRATTPPIDERLAALAHAGHIYREETLDGISPHEYERLVSRVSGIPIREVRSAADAIAHAAAEGYRSVQQARPAGAVDDWRDPLTFTGRAVWARRAEVLSVLAPGNTPAVHALWLEALALGYRVAVRPSRREPFSPHRLVSALRAAGFGDDQVVLLPTDHDAAGELLRAADLSLVYGGDDVIRKYATKASVLAEGPGRSKVLVAEDVDPNEHLDVIVDSIVHGGGTWCTNTTAVFVEGDPAPVAEAIAERLSALPSLPPEDENAALPVQAVAGARALEQHLLDVAKGTRAWLGGDGIVDKLGDGSAVLRPAVHELDRPEAEQAGIELPFPCVWVAPWDREAGIEPLRDSLVLTALTADDGLLDQLVQEPTIKNVYIGDHPTYWIEPGIPHDGYLADFLMRSKGVIRG